MDGVLAYRITEHGTCSSSYHTRCPPGASARANIFMYTTLLRRDCVDGVRVSSFMCSSPRVVPPPWLEHSCLDTLEALLHGAMS